MAFASKSPWVIHYDASSCNGCDIEVLAALCPGYDVERFGIINPKDATPVTDYKPDVIHYTAKKIKYVDSKPDFFFLFFPNDYHQALVKAEKEEIVRLIVAKIEYIP
jgi:beta-galactosidase beta subunit